MPRSGRGGCPACRRDRVVDLAAAADRSLPRSGRGRRSRCGGARRAGAVAPGTGAGCRPAGAQPGRTAAGGPPGRRADRPRLSHPRRSAAAPRCGRTGDAVDPRRRWPGACPRCRAWQLAAACSACGRIKPRRHARRPPGSRICERVPAPHRPRQPPLRDLRQDRTDRGPRPRRRAGHLRELLPDARARSAACAASAANATSPRPAIRSARHARRRRPPPAPAAAQDRPPAARWPEGPVCDPCYTAALRHRGRCASCGQQRRLVSPARPGR